MRKALEETGFNVEAAPPEDPTLAALETGEPFDLAILEFGAAGGAGVDLLPLIKASCPEAGVVMVVSSPSQEKAALEALALGAFDTLTRPVDLGDLPAVVDRALGKKRLLSLLQTVRAPGGKRPEEDPSFEGIIQVVDDLEGRDTYSEGHCRRVAMYADWCLEGMGMVGALRNRVALAGRLHDLGKLLLGGSWLNHPGPLEPHEAEAVRGHSALGERTLGDLLDPAALADIRAHHERWDGQGYPDRLAGHRIPFGGRILALADAFDAMTSNRSFRALRSPAEALAEIRSCAGSQFDPTLVPPFLLAITPRLEASREGFSAP